MFTFALGIIFLQLAVNSMFMLVIYLALAAVVIWLAFFIVGMFNPTPQVRTLITVVIAVVVLWFALHQLGMI